MAEEDTKQIRNIAIGGTISGLIVLAIGYLSGYLNYGFIVRVWHLIFPVLVIFILLFLFLKSRNTIKDLRDKNGELKDEIDVYDKDLSKMKIDHEKDMQDLKIANNRLVPYYENDKTLKQKYKSDHIDGVDWEWKWVGENVENLTPICPECSNELVLKFNPPYNRTHNYFTCENCEFSNEINIHYKELRYRVIKEIERRVRSNEYIEIVNKQNQ